jgi:hypothetical protein
MAKTITLSAGLTWPNVKNDFILRHDGLAIGRIRLDEYTWRWQVTVPMTMPLWTSGTADSLEESKRAFAAAWGRLLSETSAERLERAWELVRAVEARQHRRDAAKNISA